MRVVMASEGTYPYGGGGVSTWCHQLCEGMRDVDFTLLAVTGGPRVAAQYALPPSVGSVHHVPLWPEGACEPYLYPRGWSGVLLRRWRTTPRRIAREWAPALRVVLRDVFVGDVPADALVDAIVAMGRFLRRCEYRTTMRAAATWAAFVEAAGDYAGTPYGARAGAPSLRDVTLCARWFFHLMMPLAVELEPTTIFHATIASSCALPGVIGRRLDGTPFALTEHGVYLRERYIAISSGDHSPMVKRFLVGLAATAGRACYLTADVICPVASFNTRWELPWQAPSARVRVIYNGVDVRRFAPEPAPAPTRARPTAVVAAHVYPLKDIETLVRAAAVARARVPDLLVLVYGSLDIDPPYVARCRALVRELGLDDTVRLAGFHAEPTALYHEGDVCVLSSVSEGFPYTVIEAMACGVPCVATDVGGVREAVGDTGLVVPPRAPEALGGALADLLLDRERRRVLGLRARNRVSSQFTLARQLLGYECLYRALVEARSVARGSVS